MSKPCIALVALIALVPAAFSFAAEQAAPAQDEIMKNIETLVSPESRYMPERKMAMSFLARNAELAAGPLLDALEKHPDAQSRLWVLLCINSFEDLSVFRPGAAKIVALLNDDNFATKYWAIKTVGKMKLTSALAPLVEILGARDYLLRAAAASAVGAIGGATAPVDKLIALLQDEHMIVRASAAEALGELKNAKAKKPLIAVLEKEGESLVVKRAAVIALESITAVGFDIEPQDWSTDTKERDAKIREWIARNK